MVERVKRFADYMTAKSGVYVSDRTVKRLARRKRDPLPCGSSGRARQRTRRSWTPGWHGSGKRVGLGDGVTG